MVATGIDVFIYTDRMGNLKQIIAPKCKYLGIKFTQIVDKFCMVIHCKFYHFMVYWYHRKDLKMLPLKTNSGKRGVKYALCTAQPLFHPPCKPPIILKIQPIYLKLIGINFKYIGYFEYINIYMKKILLLCLLFYCAPNWAEPPLDFFPNDQLINGLTINEYECLNINQRGGQAVWVKHELGAECVRYFTSTLAKGPVQQAIIIFNADRLAGKTPVAYEDNSTVALEFYLNLMERWQNMPFILVARPGTYGSSGHHNQRRQRKEYLTMNGAIDELKKIYGFQRVTIGGQSGGANTTMALLTLGRTDVDCAVGSSGNYNARELAKIRAAKAGATLPPNCDTTGYCDLYTITDHVDGIKPDNKRRIYILGNPNDSNTLFQFQQELYNKIKARGFWVELKTSGGLGDAKHDMTGFLIPTLAQCIKDRF